MCPHTTHTTDVLVCMYPPVREEASLLFRGNLMTYAGNLYLGSAEEEKTKPTATN